MCQQQIIKVKQERFLDMIYFLTRWWTVEISPALHKAVEEPTTKLDARKGFGSNSPLLLCGLLSLPS